MDDMHYSINYIFNNALDFALDHPDPARRLSYHHELFGLLEKKVQEFKQLNDILKLLAGTFDSFNPLNMPPVINMLGRYASHIVKQGSQHEFFMQLASVFHLNQGSIYPLFKSYPTILVDDGKKKIPVRHYLFEQENKSRVPGDKTGVGDSIMEPSSPIPQARKSSITIAPVSLLDAQLCESFREPFAISSGIVIVPTDLVSTYFVFSNPNFRQLLKSFNKKVTFISPAWNDAGITHAERELLDFLAIPSKTCAYLKLVLGNLVDTIIIPKDTKLDDLEYSPLAKEYALVQADLTPANQLSDDFFNIVLKSLDIDRVSLRIDSLKEKVDLSEKIAAALKRYQRAFF
ncbi:MAG: hypothetical protein GYA24_15270 [Candidatus Lokiarchaeota archaeon]|nr:hypothetical protein [Candidatus Lokiarchaeota archaeon]